MANTALTVLVSSVKVMRSYDYCHFEIQLSRETLGGTHAEQLQSVDDLRKDAMRLADKSVEQYKIARSDADRKCDAIGRMRYRQEEIEPLQSKPEADLTPEDKAKLKAYKESCFFANRRNYNYEDDWQNDYSDDDN